MSGAVDILVEARRVLLDAMDALKEHRFAFVLVGAQAIYLHTGSARVALAESTKDSDFAIDPRALQDDPLLEDAMRGAGFTHHPSTSQPGSWISPRGIPVDLMVPEQLAGAGGSRSGRIAPHSDRATRRTAGLEAAVVDHAPMIVSALDPEDMRRIEMNVAGPAAILVAKLHKIGECHRSCETPQVAIVSNSPPPPRELGDGRQTGVGDAGRDRAKFRAALARSRRDGDRDGGGAGRPGAGPWRGGVGGGPRVRD